MKKLTTSEFIKRASQIHNHKFDYSLVEYKDAQSKVTIICPNGHTFEQKACDHLNGRGCKFCHYDKTSSINKITLDEVKFRLYQKYGEKFQYDFTNFRTLESKIKCTCLIHGEFEIRVSGLLKNKNCWKCKGTQPQKGDLNWFLEKSKQIHNGYYDYSKSIYTTGKNKLIIICPIHGEFLQSASAHMSGQGCPSCKMSKGEKLIRSWLLRNKINFKPQHNFDDFKRRYYDFYLPDYNICIEYDGELHYMSPKRLGGEEKLKQRQLIDKIKTEYCKRNNIKLIRIPYFEINNINTILERGVSPLPDKQLKE
jgi:very-short-patch-repair endonuclease